MHICDNICGAKEAGHKLESLPTMGKAAISRDSWCYLSKTALAPGTRGAGIQCIYNDYVHVQMYQVCVASFWSWEGCRGELSEKLPGTSPVSDRAHAKMTPGWTCHWPMLSPSVITVAPLGSHI